MGSAWKGLATTDQTGGSATGSSYTPSASTAVNMSGSGTLNLSYYTVINGIVHVRISGSLPAVTSANAVTSMNFTIPVNASGSGGLIIGHGTAYPGTSAGTPGLVTIASSTQVTFTFWPAVTTANNFDIDFEYHN
jgi:hypothetical protein